MATQHRTDRHTPHIDTSLVGMREEPHMRELLKRLANEGGDLVRSEMALAKLEMRDMAREVALDSAKLGSAFALTLAGALAVMAAAIIALGNVIDSYGWAALIIGAVLLVIGGVLARGGIAGLKDGRSPEQTIRSLKQDRQWASREMAEFKEEIRS